jgi:hypothetical protein
MLGIYVTIEVKKPLSYIMACWPCKKFAAILLLIYSHRSELSALILEIDRQLPLLAAGGHYHPSRQGRLGLISGEWLL